MKIVVCKNYEELSRQAADVFKDVILKNPSCVLGLATGSTPIGMYQELAKDCQSGILDFSHVTSYNLDEYYPMAPTHPQSYRYFMNEQLFKHINIQMDNTHVLNGTVSDPEAECKAYDAAIQAAGGIDIQVLGIGNNGHIAFNEPDDKLLAFTHVTSLTESTIQANSRFFDRIEDVPTKALSMGMASISLARQIVLLISGKAKHEALMRLYDETIDPHCPATFLKLHPNVTVFCDEEAYNG